jgi:hypothetical protein
MILREFQGQVIVDVKDMASMDTGELIRVWERDATTLLVKMIKSLYLVEQKIIIILYRNNVAEKITLDEWTDEKAKEFLNGCYSEFFRQLWKRPYLVYHKISKTEQEKYQRKLIQIAKEAVKKVCDEFVPNPYYETMLVDANNITIDDKNTSVYYDEPHGELFDQSSDDDSVVETESEQDTEDEYEDDETEDDEEEEDEQYSEDQDESEDENEDDGEDESEVEEESYVEDDGKQDMHDDKDQDGEEQTEFSDDDGDDVKNIEVDTKHQDEIPSTYVMEDEKDDDVKHIEIEHEHNHSEEDTLIIPTIEETSQKSKDYVAIPKGSSSTESDNKLAEMLFNKKKYSTDKIPPTAITQNEDIPQVEEKTKTMVEETSQQENRQDVVDEPTPKEEVHEININDIECKPEDMKTIEINTASATTSKYSSTQPEEISDDSAKTLTITNEFF